MDRGEERSSLLWDSIPGMEGEVLGTKGTTRERTPKVLADGGQERWFTPTLGAKKEMRRGRKTYVERLRLERENSGRAIDTISFWNRKRDEQVEETPFKRSSLLKHSPPGTTGIPRREEKPAQQANVNTETGSQDQQQNIETSRAMEEMIKKILDSMKNEFVHEVGKLRRVGQEGKKEIQEEMKAIRAAVEKSRSEYKAGKEGLGRRLELLEKKDKKENALSGHLGKKRW